MANITATTAANFIPIIWSNDTLDAVEYATMAPKLVCRDYEGEITELGGSVKIPHVNNYTAATKSAGSNVNFEALTHGVTTITINTHKYAAFQEEKFPDKQVLPGYRERQSRKLGYALARQLDVDVLALLNSVTGNVVGTLGVELSDNDYLSAWQALAVAGAIVEASMNEDVSTVLSPQAYVAALKVEKFINKDYGAEGDAVGRAHVGVIYGSQVYMSNLLNVPSAGQHDCGMFHRDGMALCVQQKPLLEADMIIEALAWAVVAHHIYGYGILTRPVETAGSVSTDDKFNVRLRTV